MAEMERFPLHMHMKIIGVFNKSQELKSFAKSTKLIFISERCMAGRPQARGIMDQFISLPD